MVHRITFSFSDFPFISVLLIHVILDIKQWSAISS